MRRRLPYMVLLEDDMQLRPDFRAFVERAVRGGALARADLLVLGAWGEGYVTSLASARRVLAALGRQGVPLAIDIMLNDGHAGRAVRVGGSVPWGHRVAPNGGDCLRTPHIGLQDLPRRLLHTCSGGAGCVRELDARRRLYCRAGAGAQSAVGSAGPHRARASHVVSRRHGGQAPNRSSLGRTRGPEIRWIEWI